MRLLIAFLLPFLTFFTIGRPIAGIVCLILQVTLIGWLPATIWAVYALGQYKNEKRLQDALSNRL
ncbi:YqaE/Pmp3 family membrane protein [Oxalobacteraceae bacterium R-40]|uniref:YqaE/Pmp3 family membrane protein n=1 Tax=Keguizhuia sedimenti TaxID=3064264 RepID=A0ABU1BSP5_9BURK|nr:YqaE/Pmp3 family membrane protein [Oxalobacteraceae bacterium R-40]